MASSFMQPSSARTIVRRQTAVDAAGNLFATLTVNDANGLPLETRNLSVPASGGAITDQYGTVIASSVPGALATAITNFTAALDSAIAAGATAGKFGR